MQFERLKGVAHNHCDRFGHVALPRVSLINPVANIGRLKRPSLQTSETHLTNKRAVVT